MLEVLGEHVMGGAGPLRPVPGFFGADEALTDYAPGRAEWAATLIVTARRREARERAAGVVAELARHEALRAAPEDDLVGRRRRRPMTRLTETDVTTLTRDLEAFEARLLEATGLGLRGLALRTVADENRCVQLRGARVAAVPMSSGKGVIPGFCACVVATLLHLGCDAWMTTQPDVRGMQAAVAGGARTLFLADDQRFIALNLTKGCSVDDDHATADGYVTALEAAAGGLERREVLVLGLGPVGRAAVRRLASRGATGIVVEPDVERIAAARDVGLGFEVVEPRRRARALRPGVRRDAGGRHHRRRRCARGDHRRGAGHAVSLHGGRTGGPRRASHP